MRTSMILRAGVPNAIVDADPGCRPLRGQRVIDVLVATQACFLKLAVSEPLEFRVPLAEMKCAITARALRQSSDHLGLPRQPVPSVRPFVRLEIACPSVG